MATTRVQSVDDVQSSAEQIHNCGLCKSDDLTPFFALKHLPVHVCVLGETRQEALSAPRGDVLLSYCHDCGLVQNQLYDPLKLTFDEKYESSLAYSETYCNFVEGLADRLIDRYDLHGKDIIEIGCGSGYFLQMLCQRGGNHGIGLDTCVTTEATQAVGRGSVTFVRDSLSEQCASLPCDFVCCLSVIEHIPQLQSFTKTLHKVIGKRPVNCYFEVFNAFRAFECGETWSVHYEQCNYFSEESFPTLFANNGFEVTETGTCYGGDQHLYVEARPGDSEDRTKANSADPREMPSSIAKLSQLQREKIAFWSNKLSELRRLGRSAVLWGSAGKGVSFLNMLETDGVVEHVIDVNPRRQGMFIPGTGHEILAPEFLVEHQPELVILSNGLYEAEIRARLEQLRLFPEIIIA